MKVRDKILNELYQVELSDSKKVQTLQSKYKSLKGLTRGEYSTQFSKMLVQVRKNIDVLDDIQKEGENTLRIFKELGIDNEVKELSGFLMSVKEDLTAMYEVNTLLSKF